MKEKSVTLNASGISVAKKNGIVVSTPSFSIALDPKRASDCDYTFVSHAHIDHVHTPKKSSKIIASMETARLAKSRGYDLGETTENCEGIELLDAGHILGSRAILVKDKLLYTGDFSKRDRGFLKGLAGVKCETLIMETTYGLPHYLFQDTGKIVEQVSRLIADCFHQCRPVILCGYPLGKAQLISYLFRHWEPVYLHESVHKMNEAHIDMGVDLNDFKPIYLKASSFGLLDRPPWILIAPMQSGRSSLIATMRKRFNAVVVGFTGWSLDSRYKYMMGFDHAYDISDHSDFKELVDFAKECSPSRILTVHGFASEFAAHLRTLGFDSAPLEDLDGQASLSNFA